MSDDYGSSSSSSDDSSSSSTSWSWEPAWTDSGDDRSSDGPARYLRHAEPQAGTSSAFEQALKKLFIGSLPSRAGPELLRATVEQDTWFVATDEAGAFDPVDVLPGRHRLAMGGAQPVPAAKGKGKAKRPKDGKGGRLLPVYTQDPGDGPTVRLDGRALARAIPADVDGLLVHHPSRAATEMRREHFAALRTLADACDLEDMLATPEPDQVEPLLKATFYVKLRKGKLVREHAFSGDPHLALVFTHLDRAGYNPESIEPMAGEQLFRLFVEDPSIDGLLVNQGHRIGRASPPIANLVLAPGVAQCLLAGEDARPGAHPLPARDLAEVELWLNQRDFPWEGRELLDAPYPDDTLIRAHCPEGQTTYWRMQETTGSQRTTTEKLWSPVFTIPAVRPPADAPSRILCAGLLARDLNAQAYPKNDPKTYWRPGRQLILGRLLDERDLAMSRRRLAAARELVRLLPPGADRVPRSALLTVKGAAVLRERPEAATRAWIEGTVRQAERYTRRWVWNW